MSSNSGSKQAEEFLAMKWRVTEFNKEVEGEKFRGLNQNRKYTQGSQSTAGVSVKLHLMQLPWAVRSGEKK